MPVEYNLNVPTNGLRFAIDSKNLRSFPGQNFLLQSEDFSASANWTNTNAVVITPNSTVGPFGFSGADLIVTSTTSPSLIGQSVSTTITGTGVLVGSVYAKAGTSTQFTLNCYYNGDTEYNATFNLSNGTVSGTGSPVIESVGNGWYRCYMTVPARVNAGVAALLRIWPEIRPNATGIGCYFWGAQLRTSQANNAYVATTTAAVGSSGTVYDLSGYSNDMTMNSGATTSLLNGCSFLLDGTANGNLSKTTTNSLPVGDSTILVWHRPASDAPASTYTGVLSWGLRSSASDPSTAILLSLNTGTSTFYLSNAYWGNDYVPNNANVVATAGQWNLLGLVCNAGLGVTGTSSTTLLKYNASGYAAVSGNPSAGRRVAPTNTELRVGCTDPAGTRMTKGEIGSAYVYNRVLTAAEIADFIRVTKGKYGVA